MWWRTRKQRRLDVKVFEVWCAITDQSRNKFYAAVESSPDRIDGDMAPFDRNGYNQSLLCIACQCGNLDAIAYLLSIPTTHTTYKKCHPYQQPLGILRDYRHSVKDTLKALDLFIRCPPERAQVPFKDTMIVGNLNVLCFHLKCETDMRIIFKYLSMGMYDEKRIHELKVRGLDSVRRRISRVEARQTVLVMLEHEHHTRRRWMPRDLWRVFLRMLTH